MNQHFDNVFRERLFVLILACMLLSAGGCAHVSNHVEPAFCGYHATCWRLWPADWCGCPVIHEEYMLEEIPGETQSIESLPESQGRNYQEGKKNSLGNPHAELNQSSHWEPPTSTVLLAPSLSD